MKKLGFFKIWILMSAVLVLLSGFATSVMAADEDKEEKDNDPASVIRIDDVVVRGEVVNKDLEATSATVLSHEDIINRVFITPLDIVGLSPGVTIRQYKQGGTASNFTMRGFSGNSHGANTAIFLDGIPLNEGDGYADTNIINPDEIERVELIKGPVSALYGNYASAGSLAFYTQKHVDGNHLKLQYGSYNTYEANFVGGLSDEKWDQVYSIQNYHTDGYQDNSNWDRLNAAARVTRHFTDDLNIRLSFRGFNSNWDAPGYISQEQYDEDPTQAVSETNGGKKNRVAGRADFDYRINAESKALLYFWTYNQEFWRWYANSNDNLDSEGHIGNLRDFNRFVYGTGASYNYMGDVLGRELRLIVGTDYMVEDIGRQRWYLDPDMGRNKGKKYLDYDIDMHTVDVYGEGSFQIVDPLRLVLGARYDHFSGDLTDHLENDLESSMKDQGVFSPKGGLVLSFFENRLEFFGNYGKGFALLPGFSEKAAFTQEDWDPQERTQYETGIRARPVDWFSGEIVAYRLETDKDFLQNNQTNDYENIGATTREGVEAEVAFYAFDFGYLRADYGYVDATYDDSHQDHPGKTVESVPENTYNAEIGYAPPAGLGGRLSYHYEDGYYLKGDNQYMSDGWGCLDAQVSYRFGTKTRYMLALDVVNLLDEKYAEYTSGYTSSNDDLYHRTYSPALPLSAYLTFVIDF